MKKASARKSPWTRCVTCGKLVKIKPSGGDWLNAIYPVLHKQLDGRRCEGSFIEVEDGNIFEPKRRKAGK